MENIKPFRLTRLCNCNGDLGKRWFIYFWVWDVQKNKMVRKRDYSVNQFKTSPERKAYFNQRKRMIDDLLRRGYHVDRTKLKDKSETTALADYKKVLTTAEAVETAFKISASSDISHASELSYLSAKRVFVEYLKKHHLANNDVSTFSKVDIVRFCDEMRVNRSGQTVNKYVSYLRLFWNLLLEREFVEDNPWLKIRKLKETPTNRNIGFTQDEKYMLIGSIKKLDWQLWAFVQIIYNTFSRPNEIRQLQVEDVMFNADKILIPAHKSKNKKNEFVTITEHLRPVIEELVQHKVSGQYLFEHNGRPIGKNTMRNRHKVFLDKFNISENKTLYSWKHTGVCDAYNAGIDLKRIQMQCRHHSVQQTDTYLKSLGLYENIEIKLKMPKL